MPDDESDGAEWMSVERLEELSTLPIPEGLRGDELLEWARYLNNGGCLFAIFSNYFKLRCRCRRTNVISDTGGCASPITVICSANNKRNK